ncbi:MAG: hypothetical protein ACOCVF_01000 [bacterium]
MVEIEKPYYDKHGNEIREFHLLKIFHFKGVNKNGNGRKNYYMYRWVRIKEFKNKKYYVGMYLNNAHPLSFGFLKGIADENTRIIPNAEIIQ